MADSIPYTPALKDVLTRLRVELNQLNTLNCVVHAHQGDFSADGLAARAQTEGAHILYLKHLRENVQPLFLELAKQLEVDGHIAFTLPPGESDYLEAARRWYSQEYLAGILW